ncbi:protein of unknown function [Methanocaldococcus lauensis]|uniref:Uncharacterized protein n=1 Tax=Methanocaldococcus lauensis TaxID=2546128 RepID=A0A8D6PUD6_9EURY|nr:hypothetical protein [Methanocaldococcus lauensis]CAB3288184.1 protein of unknown function [Methanocaldococcus lauensis]
MKCPMCGGDMKFVGWDIVVRDVYYEYDEFEDEYEQVEVYGIAGVYLCDNCRIGILDVMDDDEFVSEYYAELEEKIEQMGGFAKIPEGYTLLP